MNDLVYEHCIPLPRGSKPLSEDEIQALHQTVSDWSHDKKKHSITRSFRFGNYYETMAFANAVAWIAHQQDHHPELKITYNCCYIEYSTHSVGGLSRNDFICACKIDLLPT